MCSRYLCTQPVSERMNLRRSCGLPVETGSRSRGHCRRHTFSHPAQRISLPVGDRDVSFNSYDAILADAISPNLRLKLPPGSYRRPRELHSQLSRSKSQNSWYSTRYRLLTSGLVSMATRTSFSALVLQALKHSVQHWM